jgi:phosphoenolpyruvate---glycerone phosphotransferase subunit DhaL
MEAGAAVNINASDIAALIRAAHAVIDAHAQELTELDAAIGDADHGLNMKRGFEALLAESEALSQKPLGEALKAAGMKLVMTVGGASGPLYGTFLMTLGKEIDAAPFPAAFAKAVDSVAARGKSERGQKTMLDVLFPLAEALNAGVALAQLPEIAARSAEAMVPVQATRGRASFLGERSIGHMDPGSRSCVLLTEVAVEWFEARSPEGIA